MIVVIAHIKGGVGKSTITVNLAVELQRQGKDVVMLEADPTVRTVSNWAGDREEYGHPRIQCLQQTGNLHSVLLDDRSAFQKCLDDGRGVVEMKDPKAKAEIQLLTQEVMGW